MSSYGGKCGCGCGCGSACNCGCGCGRCGMYPDLGGTRSTTTKSMIIGASPQKGHFEGIEMAAGSESGGCNCKCGCGPNCHCDSCSCCN